MASCPVDFSVTKHTVTPRLTSPDLTIDWSQAMVLDYVAGPASVIPSEAEVEFRDGTGRLLSRDALVNGKRRAAITPADVGTIKVSARIGPDEWLQGPTRSLTFTVVRGVAPRSPAAKPNAKPTRITMAVDPAASQWDSGAPVTVDVDPATTGRVMLYSGARAVGQTTLDRAGKGTIRLGTLPPGSHPLVAIYQGTKRFAPSRTAKRTLNIVRTATTTTLSVDRTSIQWGGRVTATATVAPNPGGGVVHIDGQRVPIDAATGMATVELAGLTPGANTILARFDGRSPFGPSSASTTVTVDARASSVDFSVAVGTVSDEAFARAGVSVHPLVEQEALGEERNGRYDLFVDGRRIASRWDGGSTSFQLKLDPGTYDLQVKYRGNGILAPSVAEVQTIQVGSRSAAPKRPAGTAIRVGPSRTAEPVVLLRLSVDETGGHVRGFQLSNDGEHWATWWLDVNRYSPNVTVQWSLLDCGGGTTDGERTIRVRFLDDVVEEVGSWMPIPAGGVLRSEVITIPVVLDR
jgi:hypothetical protein